MSIRVIRWPHAPSHVFGPSGTYIVTSSTYRKQHHFTSASKLNLLQEFFFTLAEKHAISLQAWAIFSNHYHFVAQVAVPEALSLFTRQLHSITARELNQLDHTPDRRVWFQYWETALTYERSYFARLHYVHRNPVHHGITRAATRYPWCSAAWFETEAPVSFRKTIYSVPCDTIRIADNFQVQSPTP
jgi:putative transposase